ncbi:MAG: electron transfer flavoprotein subunit alpha/FixB family protein [Ardenticatenaceae bacterium]|nr:electron transfer flavoprotein subunit alpha/FixB family protein [Anaerolineales bacterium]MCB8941455.1 electron transfer flavoprotein subunit alpha/FixB family protein [Ardenticatenaceae bacterium]MCB8974651.1 electron transfer flavoprotein subunit alpha/FixB family protein [Ardenticatenaceae bacterium]
MILGIIEHDRGQLNNQSLEMLTLARQVAADEGVGVTAVLIGTISAQLADNLAAYGVSHAIVASHDGLDEYAPEAWAAAIGQIAQANGPKAIMATGSDRGNELMAHVAAQLNLAMAANVTQVTVGDSYQLTRVRWGGSLFEEAKLHGDIKLLTVAPLVQQVSEAPSSGVAVETFTPELDDKLFRVRVTSREEPEADKISLAEARLVVGGGRGVGSADGFALLDELAGLLEGAVGGSRVVTNLGWRPHADQIGQTGTRIAPDLYIACGISGAIQHWVGCKGAKKILAINTDPEAPMMTKADYAVIGDLHEVLPALIAELQK